MLKISLVRLEKLSCMELLINFIKYSFANEKWWIISWSLFIRVSFFKAITKIRLC